jgi:hypothetical protein
MSQQSIGFWASLTKAGTNVNITVSETAEMVANYATAGNAISKKVAVKCIVDANREINETIPEGSTIQAELDAFNSIKLR